jgi:hypothetical protein
MVLKATRALPFLSQHASIMLAIFQAYALPDLDLRCLPDSGFRMQVDTNRLKRR